MVPFQRNTFSVKSLFIICRLLAARRYPNLQEASRLHWTLFGHPSLELVFSVHFLASANFESFLSTTFQWLYDLKARLSLASGARVHHLYSVRVMLLDDPKVRSCASMSNLRLYPRREGDFQGGLEIVKRSTRRPISLATRTRPLRCGEHVSIFAFEQRYTISKLNLGHRLCSLTLIH